MLTIDRRNARTWSMLGACGAFGMAAVDLAQEDERLNVVTADLTFFSGLERLHSSYPDRIVNVGIAEQNMVGVAGGMAKEGMNVFATTYASFACTRALDQVKVNMGYMKMPIKLVGLTAGYSVGILGPTHMSLEDVAIMRSIPNITILNPADCTETIKCVYAAASADFPVYLRMNGAQRVPIVYSEDYNYEIGKGIVLREGSDIVIYATGTLVYESLNAAKKLAEEGIECTVVDMHTIKPLDVEVIRKYNSCSIAVTAEEHNIIGGLGSAVAETITEHGYSQKLVRIGVNDQYYHAANYDYLMEKSGLKSHSIVDRIKSAL